MLGDAKDKAKTNGDGAIKAVRAAWNHVLFPVKSETTGKPFGSCPPTWCRSDVILPLSLLTARPLAPSARLALAVFHAFKLQAIGISEEHGIVVVVVLPRRIDDGRA